MAKIKRAVEINPPDNKFVVQRNAKFTIDWWKTNHGKNPRDARRLIARMMSKLMFTVNSTPVKLGSLTKLTGEAPAKPLSNEAVFEGVVTAVCNVSPTMVEQAANPLAWANYGFIEAGAPVVLDTVTGYALTGISETWLPDEYIILGTALRSAISTDGLQELPVLLHKQHNINFGLYTAVIRDDMVSNRPVRAIIIGGEHIQSIIGPGEETPYDINLYNFIGSQTGGSAPNSGTHDTRFRKGSRFVVAYENKSARWIAISPQYRRPFIRGTLDEDIPSGGSGRIEIWASDPAQPSGVPVKTGEKVVAVDWHTPPQLTLKKGIRASASWDNDSMVYVITGINELDYYGELTDVDSES